MTGRNLIAMLESEARRRPQIAAMLEIITVLSDEDIDTADVPLPWYRKALKAVRDERIGAMRMETLSQLMSDPKTSPVRSFVTEHPMGTQIIYTGSDLWLNKPNGIAALIPYGTMLFVTDSGQLWHHCSCIGVPTAELNHHSVIRRSTLAEYKAAYHNRLLGSHSDAPVIASEQPSSGGGRLSSLGVRIG